MMIDRLQTAANLFACWFLLATSLLAGYFIIVGRIDPLFSTVERGFWMAVYFAGIIWMWKWHRIQSPTDDTDQIRQTGTG